MTATEQGIFLVDREGIIRHRSVVGPLDPVQRGGSLAELVRTHCPAGLWIRSTIPARSAG